MSLKNILRSMITVGFTGIMLAGLVKTLNAKVTPEQFNYLNELFELNRMEELIIEGEKIKINNKENLQLRALLFKAYLHYNFFPKAQEEISFLESRIKNAQTTYLRALQAYFTNNLKASLILLDKITDKRYAPPYLLYFKIYVDEGKFKNAETVLNQYRELEGENNEWFFYYGKYLLAVYEPKTDKKKVRHHLLKYAKAFPVNHRQMYLKADYFAAQNQFDRALQYIDKALYLSSERIDYLDRKLYYLYRDQKFQKLSATIDKTDFSSKNRFIHYQWIKSFINFVSFKKKDGFSLKSSKYLNQVLSPLEKIIELNPENEIIRFFIEEILIANTDQTDKRRKPYADYYYQKANLFKKKGMWVDTIICYDRMLRLYPQKQNYREAYLEYLRLTQQYESYKIEADNYVYLYSNRNQNILIRKQLAEKKLRESLKGRYKLKETIPSPQVKTLLIYEPRSFKDSWSQPYLEAIVAYVIKDVLQIPPLLQVDIIRKDQVINMLEKSNYNYLIEFNINDYNQILTIEFIIRDQQKTIVYQKPHFFYGKDRYQKMGVKLYSLVYDIFPKVGSVVNIKERQAVISLGKLHGVKEKDQVALYKNKTLLGFFPLKVINNYYSLITIDKIFTLSQTEIRDRAVIQNYPDK